MKEHHLTAGIITAAGRSTRMDGVKKELARIDGTPVLKIVGDVFARCGVFDYMVITYPPSSKESDYRAVLEGVNLDILLTSGGQTRQESVYNALLTLSGYPIDYVLIHDAARPWVTDELIKSVLRGAEEFGACIPVVPHINASKRIDEDGKVVDHYDRSIVVGAQTPQGFKFADILAAHEEARRDGREYPDDAGAYHHTIGKVHAVAGDPANRKITYRYDL